jgi:hypothetical protein
MKPNDQEREDARLEAIRDEMREDGIPFPDNTPTDEELESMGKEHLAYIDSHCDISVSDIMAGR